MNPTRAAIAPVPPLAAASSGTEHAELEVELVQAEAARETLQGLLRHAHEARQLDVERGADPVVLCHHAELLSLIIRRLAETELRVVEARLGLRQ